MLLERYQQSQELLRAAIQDQAFDWDRLAVNG